MITFQNCILFHKTAPKLKILALLPKLTTLRRFKLTFENGYFNSRKKAFFHPRFTAEFDQLVLCRVFNICVILSIELSVLSEFQIPLKLRRRVIIAPIIRSGYNLIKAWKRLASAKTLQTHFNNRIIYSQKWYFTTSKLLRSMIPKINHFTTHSRKTAK